MNAAIISGCADAGRNMPLLTELRMVLIARVSTNMPLLAELESRDDVEVIPNFEIRNPKSETNPNVKMRNAENGGDLIGDDVEVVPTGVWHCRNLSFSYGPGAILFHPFLIADLNLFRISGFEIRISPQPATPNSPTTE